MCAALTDEHVDAVVERAAGAFAEVAAEIAHPTRVGRER